MIKNVYDIRVTLAVTLAENMIICCWLLAVISVCYAIGCPVRQEVDAVVKATACGCGLEKAIVDKTTEFVVDVKGDTGDLCLEIQGQLSLLLVLNYCWEMTLYFQHFTS